MGKKDIKWNFPKAVFKELCLSFQANFALILRFRDIFGSKILL